MLLQLILWVMSLMQTNANLLQEMRILCQQYTGKKFMTGLYQKLPIANPAYRRLAELLAEPTLKPIIQHCTIDKDRTAVGCALPCLHAVLMKISSWKIIYRQKGSCTPLVIRSSIH